MENIDLSKLLPNFSSLWEYIRGDLSFNTEVFSASIVGFLILVAFGFALYSFFAGFIPAKSRIRKIKHLVSGLTPENLVQSRRTLLEKAGRLDHLGKLWKEFDETLIVSSDGIHLNNTIDAEHFFNSHTLAPHIADSRLVAAVPGFLTAIGVIGTFAGLQLGLGSITFSGDVQDQSEDIRLVIASASVAFLTSVWGISLSVLFNFYEKSLEQIVKIRITELQHLIDFLFPRIRPEHSLVTIATSSKSSEDSLNGLAERIGEQLQQAVSGMGEQVTAGIQGVMQPAMDSLVSASNDLANRMSDGATDTLAQLVRRFMSGISEAAENQQHLMAEATADMKESMTSWQSQMTNLFDNLETQNSASNDREKQLKEELFEKLTKFSDMMTSSANQSAETSRETLEQNQKLTSEMGELAERLSNVMVGLDSYSKRIADASVNIDNAGLQIRSATQLLENQIQSAIKAVTELSTENDVMVKNTNQILEQIQSLKGDLQSTSDTMGEASREVSRSFEKMEDRQKTFIKSMESTLSQYESSMKSEFETLTNSASNFLNDYTERVREQTNFRLDDWNKQTEEFTRQMVSTVQSLQSLLDEIEDTFNKLRTPDA